MLQLWDHGDALHPCKCPLCRREISLLVPSGASSRQHHSADVADILERIERYNRLYSGFPSGLMQRMQELPFLLKRLLRDIMDSRRSLPLAIRARVYLAVFATAAYFLYPLDIIPDGLLGIFGFMDDMFVLFISFMHIAAIYRAVLLDRQGGAQH
ncbi:uncharacterized protein LOC127257127 isoform X2 [Andrographis paniculata]|nr:uncharacterized protein LOC127257127 isoform X2 [Andrographis paniculata]